MGTGSVVESGTTVDNSRWGLEITTTGRFLVISGPGAKSNRHGRPCEVSGATRSRHSTLFPIQLEFLGETVPLPALAAKVVPMLVEAEANKLDYTVTPGSKRNEPT